MRPNLLRRLRGNVCCGPRPAALHDDAVKVEIRTLALNPPVMPGLASALLRFVGADTGTQRFRDVLDRPGGLKSPPERSRSAPLRIETLNRSCCLAPNLTCRSLISARCFDSRWRVGVSFDAVTIDQKYRAVAPHVMVLDQDHVAIVQREPMAIEPCGDNRVVFIPEVVPQDDNAKVIRRNPCLLEGNEFCDRVILAVPATYGECRQLRTPDVRRTVKC